jgi:hypothetical protein
LQAATSASATISQTQGPGLASTKITAFDVSGAPQQTAFVNDINAGGGMPVTITSVKVNGVAVSFTPDGNGVIVGGLKDGDTIQWTTSAPHERALIEGVAGKFDIGRFDITQTTPANVDIGAQLRFEDDGPTITATATGAPTLTVDETVLATNDTKTFAAQFTKNFGTDGAAGTDSVTYALSTLGGASGLTDTATGQSVVLSLVNGQVLGKTTVSGLTVFAVSVDASGNVTLDQQRAIVHTNPNDPDESRGLTGTNLVVLTATATDKDGDHASAPLDLTPQLVFKDDGPSITATATGAPTLTVDETVLATDDTKLFAGQFTPTFGADGQGATPVSYALSIPGGTATGLTDTATGQSVVLSLVNGQVLGKTAVSGLTVFLVSVDASGNVTLDQQRAIVHTNPNDPDESRGLTGSNLVVLTATATDKDGDHASVPLDLTPLLVFKDDGPTIGPISNSTVDFSKGATGTAGPVTLNGVLGADGPASAAYTIVGTYPDISINNTALHPVLSNNNETITYSAAGTDGQFGTADDVPFYRLTLGETGAGSYTFSVLIDPPPAKLTFDLSTLAAGQNLWGAAADTTKADGFEVFASGVTLNPDGTQASGGTINTSKGGGPTTIGISNQMFDPTEGAFFTYVTSPTTGGSKDADDISYNKLFDATEAQASISQTQGNTTVALTVKAFEINSPVSPDPTLGRDLINGAGTGGQVSITSLTITHSNGTTESETAGGQDTSNKISFSNGIANLTGLAAGDTFDWTTSGKHDQVLISDVSGKFDIGAFNIIQTQPTPAQDLPFTVQATDGDGDHAQSSFNVHINPVLV